MLIVAVGAVAIGCVTLRHQSRSERLTGHGHVPAGLDRQRTLAKNPQSVLGLIGADGTMTPVVWPFGYTARNELGRLVLLDAAGNAVAREGDEVALGGGTDEKFWYACGG